MIADRLARLRNWYFKQKYVFDQGYQFIQLLTFSLLAVGVPKLFGFRAWWGVLFIPLAFVGVWWWGGLMDKYGRSTQKTEEEYLKRSIAWQFHLKKYEEIVTLLRELKERNENNSQDTSDCGGRFYGVPII